MCEEIRSYVIQDEELCRMSQERLGEEHYPDSAFHILVDDIVYFGSRMEEPTEESEWFPAESVYHPGITAEKWEELLQNKKVFNDDSLAIMKRLLDHGGQGTCTELSQTYGENINFYNSGSSLLAKRVHKELDCPVMADENSNKKWWPILFIGKNTDGEQAGRFIWKLRPELEAALKTIDLS